MHLSTTFTPRPSPKRLLLAFVGAIVIGLLSGSYVTLAHVREPSRMASDLTWVLHGATALWDGQNPYKVPMTPLPYWTDQPLFYPLPALLLALPLIHLPESLAAGIFYGASSALLAFALICYRPTLLLLFLSSTYSYALLQVQWSPLLLGSAFLPGLSVLLLCKPNVGLPLFFFQPNKYALFATACVLLLTLMIIPSWPIDMLANTSAHHNFIPVLVGPGFLIVLALLRWREPRYWPFLVFMFMPQRSFYDQLPLWLVCTTWKEALVLATGSWLAFFGWPLLNSTRDEAVVLCMYLPALVIVLRPHLTEAYISYRTQHGSSSTSPKERLTWVWMSVARSLHQALPLELISSVKECMATRR